MTPPAGPKLGRLHLLTDTGLQQRFSHLSLAKLALKAGAPVVQYRNKDYLPERDWAELQAIYVLLKDSSTQLIINDRLDLAYKLEGTGVHLGKGDATPQEAISVLPPSVTVGATVHFRDEYEAIKHLPLSYIGVGPVFGTASKTTSLPPLGLEGLEKICNFVNHPVIAIGSITYQTIPDVMACGAYGVAVLSSFTQAADPSVAVAAMLERLHSLGYSG